MSSFGGIQQAASSLAASQYGLQIVEQNISNASTPGYTRQSVDLASADSVGGVPRRYVTGGGPAGVNVTGTSRLNDPIIDARDRTEHARSSQTDTAASQLSQIEDVFPEPSTTGLGAQLTTFWGDWSNVANNPSDGAARTVLLQDAGTVTSTLNAMSTSLSDVADSTAQSLTSDVGSANTAASSLSALNGQIALGTATGSDINSLLDQRDQLLDQLSSLVGGAATINADGTADVSVGGQSLVTAAKPAGPGGTPAAVPASYTQLAVPAGSPTTINLVASDDPTTIVHTGITLGGGSAAASVVTLNATLPGVQSQLDNVAKALAGAVNYQQTQGYDLQGNTGTAIFAGTGGSTDLADVTAASIHVALGDPTRVAASSTPPTVVGGVTTPNNGGGNALIASTLATQANPGEELTAGDPTTALGTPDNVYGAVVGSVGGQSALAQHSQTTQDAITASVDALRQSASGVNLDEEVTNMLTLQQAYQASSKVLSTMNTMLDTLINQTGIGS